MRIYIPFTSKVRRALVVALVGGISGLSSIHGATVGFTLSLDTAKDPGSSYTNFRAAGAGLQSTFVIGFNVDIATVNGSAQDINPVAAFCVELAEPIQATSYTFTAGHLYEASAGRAGEASTASSNISTGGIGALRAARLRYLFNEHYQSVRLSEWTQTTTSPTLHAFQLAVWELSHDTDLNLTNTSGSIYVGNQSSTLRNNAIALAQTWLNEISAANVAETYESPKFEIWSLISESGNSGNGRGYQDVLLAFDKTSPDYETLKPLLPAPEPGATLLCLSATFLALRRRRTAN